MKKILIVDDEPIILRALSRALAHESFEILTAPDGKAGLKSIETHAPDLVLLDILMPHLSGLDVLEKIRKSNNTVPVILMTAYGDTHMEQTAKRLNVTAYLKKPFNQIETVIDLVKRTLQSA